LIPGNLLISQGIIPRPLGRSMLLGYPAACGGVVHFFNKFHIFVHLESWC
jgi:hypothetical protein